jgi:hypothetical protein
LDYYKGAGVVLLRRVNKAHSESRRLILYSYPFSLYSVGGAVTRDSIGDQE